MKKAPPTGREASTAWPVPWWRTCVACGLLFKWESAWKGWRWATRPQVLAHLAGRWRAFVCLKCAPVAEAAEKHFGAQEPPPRHRLVPSTLPPSRRAQDRAVEGAIYN